MRTHMQKPMNATVAAWRAFAAVVLVGSALSAPPARGQAGLERNPQHESQPAAGFDLITNGSFEDDWHNSRPELMSCPVEPRVTFGQADSYPDGWGLADAKK